MNTLSHALHTVDEFVWGPCMLLLLVGTGIVLTVRTRFLPWRHLPRAIKSTLNRNARTLDGSGSETSGISPFAALMTSLAATIGTGNIVGVSTAMVLGGPGALVWMWIAAAFGISSKFGECMLAVKYREVNARGEIVGGPMYTLKKAFPNRRIGAALAFLFALFAVISSFGIGNMTQANSISEALRDTFFIPPHLTGAVLTVLTLSVVVGGIRSISGIASVLVPSMAFLYIAAGLIVLALHYQNIPDSLVQIVTSAFSVKAFTGGLSGTAAASMLRAMRYGIARGVFSNEAGMGSAAVTAASAAAGHPVRQGYINMTAPFWDTVVVCSITGLCIMSSGVLGCADGTYECAEPLTGAALTIAAFRSGLGSIGAYFLAVSIVLFAFSTILGWEYLGERAWEYLIHTHKYNMLYRIVFALTVYVGATAALDMVWDFSNIANALMAMPNLICLLALSGEIAADILQQKSLR